ncbi:MULTISPECIES: helix-turn-helix domain-containing protein [Lysobacter]|jgi:CRP/FNR family transcriptional regulator|uniref:helix-turn-helix domain-containing protein n=1 Tax=Lysobacter TaxID=68 RepID=UPI001F38C0BE|nr:MULTISPECIES: helix-turn-helix domain-containing protein [Lysobacter]UJB21678.1 helix-turn-helix domain-containing protein [Lysobacter capsici]UJQ29205.1 helix-turn-helix domain-containing protein [Lysobacter gummosus]
MLLDSTAHVEPSNDSFLAATSNGRAQQTRSLEQLLQSWPLQRRRVHAKQYIFRAGQPRHALYLVHAGFFKTAVISEDGREKITGFRMRGDLLGLDALDMPAYACDAMALDTGELWELPYAQLRDELPQFQERITALLAGEIRRDWGWMLALGTLGADQRVITFLFDLASRFEGLGFSPNHLQLRMTRAELGNFLSLTLETVTRVLSRLQARGLIAVAGREIRIQDRHGLQTVLRDSASCH